eukprot:Clim_evm8s3 gene=Clim_evmTU8s3
MSGRGDVRLQGVGVKGAPQVPGGSQSDNVLARRSSAASLGKASSAELRKSSGRLGDTRLGVQNKTLGKGSGSVPTAQFKVSAGPETLGKASRYRNMAESVEERENRTVIAGRKAPSGTTKSPPTSPTAENQGGSVTIEMDAAGK